MNHCNEDDTSSAQYDQPYEVPDLRRFAWLLVSLPLTLLSFLIGFVAQRFFF